LCTQMTASLRLLQGELDFDIELVNIDLDSVLRDRYNVDVPVVALDGEVVCYHFFEEDIVRESIETYDEGRRLSSPNDECCRDSLLKVKAFHGSTIKNG